MEASNSGYVASYMSGYENSISILGASQCVELWNLEHAAEGESERKVVSTDLRVLSFAGNQYRKKYNFVI